MDLPVTTQTQLNEQMSSISQQELFIISEFVGSPCGPGCVFDLSTDSFRDFVMNSIGIDVFDKQYSESGASNGKRLMALLQKKPDRLIGRLLDDLILYAKQLPSDSVHLKHIMACICISKRLQNIDDRPPARPVLFRMFQQNFGTEAEIDLFCKKEFPHLLAEVGKQRTSVEKLDTLLAFFGVDVLMIALSKYSREKNMEKSGTTVLASGQEALEVITDNAATRPSSVNRSRMGISTEVKILHLSDLHFEASSNPAMWYTQLANDLKYDLRCEKLDILLISGDIANRAHPDEYKAAEVFLKSVMEEFDLASEQIVLVPGNHDVFWPTSIDSYEAKRRPIGRELVDGCYIGEAKAELIQIRDEQKYSLRFSNFSEFFKIIRNTNYPLNYDEQTTLQHFPEHKLLILGLNSAWEIDHHFKARASIHQSALARSFMEIRRNPSKYRDCIKIATWHHSLSGEGQDRIRDAGFLEQLAQAGFSLGLHGHIHKAENHLFRDSSRIQERNIELIGAGTFGATSRDWSPGFPLQYQLLHLSKQKLVVHTRKREEPNGAWKPDPRWKLKQSEAYAPYYEIELAHR